MDRLVIRKVTVGHTLPLTDSSSSYTTELLDAMRRRLTAAIDACVLGRSTCTLPPSNRITGTEPTFQSGLHKSGIRYGIFSTTEFLIPISLI